MNNVFFLHLEYIYIYTFLFKEVYIYKAFFFPFLQILWLNKLIKQALSRTTWHGPLNLNLN